MSSWMTLATIWCQSKLSSAAVMICVRLTLSSQHVDNLSRNFSLWHPLAPLPSTLQVTTKCLRLCFLITCSQRNQVAVDGLYSIACTVHLLLSVLPGCFSFRSMISITSSAKITFHQPSTCPSLFLKSSSFHIRTAKLVLMVSFAAWSEK